MGIAILRFIPVLTGNTELEPILRLIMPVYPRTYGEHDSHSSASALSTGLSPYLRGTPGRCRG
ncbi:conserved hypothetical protein [Xenorhabdus nematophila F1]|nr:conserved hypothetical protein [Xenorhabdus nematophila F1]